MHGQPRSGGPSLERSPVCLQQTPDNLLTILVEKALHRSGYVFNVYKTPGRRQSMYFVSCSLYRQWEGGLEEVDKAVCTWVS